MYYAHPGGTIWSVKRKGGNDCGAGRIGPPRKLRGNILNGYIRVSLDIDGKVFSKSVHRLILETFRGVAPEGYHACHYPDPNRKNNRIENLRWDTAMENAKDKYRDHPIATTKCCNRCGYEKEKKDFYSDKRAIDGLKTECKICHSKVSMDTRDPLKKRLSNRIFMRNIRRLNPSYGRSSLGGIKGPHRPVAAPAVDAAVVAVGSHDLGHQNTSGSSGAMPDKILHSLNFLLVR